jgi:hypothetical protein
MEIELPYSNIYYEAPIIYIEYKKDAELGFGEIRQLVSMSEELSGHKPYVVLSDVRNGISITPMGKKIAADPSTAPLHRGTAVLLRNNMLRLAANFFGTSNPYPFRAFTDRQKAVEWLLSLPLIN